MSELKKLFQVKRILAMVLAAAMTITSLPATALAAEPVDTSAVTEAEAEDTSAQSNTEIETEGEQTSQLTAEATEDDVDAAQTGAADQSVADDTDQPNQTSAADVQQDDEDSVQVQAEGDTAADGAKAAEEIGTSEFNGRESAALYDADGNSPVADGGSKKLSTSFLSNYSITVNQGKTNASSRSLDDLTDPIVATVTYQWFAGDSALGDAKKLTEEGVLPVDAGEYTLKFVLPAKANEYDGAEATFGYEISKPEVTVYIEEPEPVAVGTKWSDVPVPAIDSVVAYDNDKFFTYVTDDPDTEPNEAANNEVAFKVVIKDAATGVTLTGDQTLVKNGEYMLSVVPEFIGANKEKYEKNYTWAPCEEQKITIGELKETRLTLKPADSYEAKAAAVANDDNERTVHIIEAESFTDKLQKLDYTAVLEIADGVDEQGKTKWKTLEGEIAGAWYTAASYSEPWTEGTKTYCNLTLGSKMDTVPETAGAYVYRVSYEGDQKEYADCYADILVIVNVAEIIVRPTVSDKIVFYDGESVKDVLSQITYVLPYADGRTDTKGEPALYPQTDNMWGTSYVPSGVTQPYKPDFELVEIVKDEEGKEIDRNTYTSSNSSATLTLGNDYIVRFTGQKNVYNAGGSVSSRKDINESVDSMDPITCGFKVMTDQDTLEAEVNTVSITVVAKDKAIDVTEIEKAATDKAKMTKEIVGVLEDAYTKIYDNSRIFDLYADYKKAKLTSGSSDPVKDFGYQWEKSSYTYEDLLGTHKETVDGQETDVPDVSKEDLNDSWSSDSGISPIDAGVYRLVITYRSSRVKGYAEPEYVYFVIKKQEITLTFDENTTLTGNVGNNITVFTTNHANKLGEGTTLTPSMDQPAKAEDWKNVALLSTSADYAYEVSWGFYRKAKTTDAEGQEVDLTDEEGKPVYNTATSLQSTGEYFLGVRSINLGSYNPKYGISNAYTQNYDVKKDVYVPITVKAMGTDAIKFDGITTTGGQQIEKTKTYDGESIYDLIKNDLETLNKPIVIKNDETTGAETKVPVTFAAEEEYRLTYTVEYDSDYSNEVKTYDTLPTDEEEWAWAKNGGTYTITAQFAGNERYARLYTAYLATINVEQMELVLTLPTLIEEFEAGQSVSAVMNAAYQEFNQQAAAGVKPKKNDETIPDADMEKYFTKTVRDGQTGFLAWYDNEDGYSWFGWPDMSIYDSSIEEYLDDDNVLQGAADTRYSLRGNYNYFYDSDCEANYVITDIEPAEGTPIKVVRGASTVTMNEYSQSDNKKTTKVDITDNISTPKELVGDIVKEHTVTIQDGIAYSNGSPEGNIVTIAIQAPAEYNEAYLDWSKVGYEQSIKNAAGNRLIGSVNRGYNNITFTYNATALDETDKKDLEFCIRWEEGYSEKFILKFSEATLLGNLQEAVAPKSLAFNGAPKTMVVGQDQALDVKITKVQNADIICLGYEVTAGKEYMHVDEFGKVTALKEGKATVEVYPMHLVDGKKERIVGAKSAKTTITVKKVSAPKVTKVTAKDTSITVEYTMLNSNDGYRREIYVVEGKNVKADVIERKVTDEMKNEQWQGIFAVAPVFVSYSNEVSSRVYDYKKGSYANTARVTISDLDPQKDYTVYVRNVSAVHSFADGCQVSLSVAGTAKACKTSAKLMEDIVAVLKDEEIKEIDYDEVYSTPTQDEIWDAYEIGYEVPLTKKDVQISLEGLFTDAAGDDTYAALPLAGQDLKDLKNTYAAPKIAYYFEQYIYDGYDELSGSRVIEGYGYTKTSSIATINNKGKVTLKQPGWVSIYAVDTVSGVMSNEVRIHITAEADSIAAKNTTMEVGQTIRLENLVVYKQGKTVLNQSYYSSFDRIDVKAAQTSLKSAGKENSFGISNEGYLTAYAKDSVSLTLQDTILNKSVTVKITAKDLSPVKNLKAVNVIDNRFDVQFEMNPYAEAYRIEITDATKIIRSIYVENIPCSDAPTTWDDYSYEWVHDPYYTDDDWGTGSWDSSFTHYSDHWYRGDNAFCRADKTNGKWVLTYRIQKLTQASKYNISVTALYKDVKSKIVKKAVTTTKLPAYDYPLTGKIEAGETYSVGMGITVRSGNTTISRSNLVSGNTYNLEASGANQNARRAGTDTLTWTSSNKKVATVQATSGGYGAVLKALKDGETVIEVKSKILKAPVARYTISVSTVGDAYKGRDYYGDNEDLRGDGTTKPDAVTELVVGVAEPVELSAGQSKTFKVTLMEEGQYTAYRIINGIEYSFDDVSVNSRYNTMPYTWNITVNGSITGSVIVKKTGNVNSSDFKNRTVIQLDETVSGNGAWYVFTVPKTGLYGVIANGKSNVDAFRVYKQSAEPDAELNRTDSLPAKYFYELEKGDVVYLEAGSYASVQITEAKFEPLPVGGDPVEVSSRSDKWFEFTSEEADQYEFTDIPSGSITVYDEEFNPLKVDGSKNTGYANGYYHYTYTYAIDGKVYIRIDNTTWYDVYMSVKKKGSYQSFGTDGTCTINRDFTGYDDYLYISYKVPVDGFYTFSYDLGEQAGTISGYAELYDKANEQSRMDYMSISSSWQYSIEDRYLAENQEVYLKIKANSPYPAEWTGVTIKVEKTGDAPDEIAVGSAAEEVTVPANKSVWYSFTADETADYVVTFLKTTDSSKNVSARWYTDVMDDYSYIGSSKSVNLLYGAFMDAITVDEGVTIYLKITNSATSDNRDCKVMIQKMPADGVAVTEADPVELNLATNLVSFTADADAYYTFSIEKNASNTAGYIYAYEDKENTMELAKSAYNGPLSMVLDEGQQIWLKVTANYPVAEGKEPDQLKVERLGEIQTVSVEENNTITNVINPSNPYAIVKFTADEEGDYTFKSSTTGVSRLDLYKSDDLALSSVFVSSTTVTSGEGEEAVTAQAISNHSMSSRESVYIKISLNVEISDLTMTVTKGTVEPEGGDGGDTDETTP
ncbi:MAG: hypothetical protein HDR09_05520 [Lachnospiraceae bacterium]|nr:hypothetical protein [Lachnospiraceae bacterium]